MSPGTAPASISASPYRTTAISDFGLVARFTAGVSLITRSPELLEPRAALDLFQQLPAIADHSEMMREGYGDRSGFYERHLFESPQPGARRSAEPPNVVQWNALFDTYVVPRHFPWIERARLAADPNMASLIAEREQREGDVLPLQGDPRVVASYEKQDKSHFKRQSDKLGEAILGAMERLKRRESAPEQIDKIPTALVELQFILPAEFHIIDRPETAEETVAVDVDLKLFPDEERKQAIWKLQQAADVVHDLSPHGVALFLRHAAPHTHFGEASDLLNIAGSRLLAQVAVADLFLQGTLDETVRRHAQGPNSTGITPVNFVADRLSSRIPSRDVDKLFGDIEAQLKLPDMRRHRASPVVEPEVAIAAHLAGTAYYHVVRPHESERITGEQMNRLENFFLASGDYLLAAQIAALPREEPG